MGQIFKTCLENVFGRIWEDLPKMILRKSGSLLKLFRKICRKALSLSYMEKAV